MQRPYRTLSGHWTKEKSRVPKFVVTKYLGWIETFTAKEISFEALLSNYLDQPSTAPIFGASCGVFSDLGADHPF